MKRRRMLSFAFFAGFLALAIVSLVRANGDWRSASQEPVGLAPDAASTPEPVVQVYAARTWGARGLFGSHTWVATKAAHAKAWTVYEVIGWRLRWSDNVIAIHERAPDARWYGNAPELLADKRGTGVEALIAKIDAAARAYPHAHEYVMWPGPNSNTFTAWIARSVPELKLDLPPTAIGKDFVGGRVLATAPSGSGVQLTLAGLLALTASGVEGLEFNLLGLTFGINPFEPALKLPILGRLGAPRAP